MQVDEIMVLRVADLRLKLSELSLQTTGVKRDLQSRLLLHYGHHDEEDDDKSVITALSSPGQNVASNEERTENRSWLTLKDVEGSVSQFSGSDSRDINQWVEELEECAMTVQWSRLHLFIYVC